MNMTRPPAKYLNVLHQNKTQKQLQHFFPKMLQKCYQLWESTDVKISGYFHQKQ